MIRHCYIKPVLSGILAHMAMMILFTMSPVIVRADCTGCTTTNVGDDVVHTFTSDGTFTPPSGVSQVQYLLVAGGAGGGGVAAGGNVGGAGGGGAGGMLAGTGFTVTPLTVYNVVVGAGGAPGVGGVSQGGNGQNSSFSSLTAIGGGGGASHLVSNTGVDGGSGGGGRITGNPGGAGVAGQGNDGGAGNNAAGGGGGAGSAGANGGAAVGGAGGNGLSSNITGVNITYAAGGNGGNYGARAAGVSAAANTGNGGSGASGANGGLAFSGGAGGSGIVVIRYTTPPPDAVLEWQMEETTWNGTAGEVTDSSGNNRDGTAVNGPVTASDNPAIAGSPGTCRYGVFDGANDYIELSGLSGLLNATASLSFWINTTQTGNNTGWQAPGITGVEEAGGADDIFWGWLDASGNIGISVANDFTTKSSTAINDGNWHHIVLTRDHIAGQYKIYIDGNLNASGSIATGVIGTAFSSIGRIEDTGGSPEYFDGLLDEVRIYAEVLTDSDVLIIRDETHPCPAPAPLAYYALDEDTWGTILDSSGNGFDASAVGSVAPDPYPVTVPPGEALAGDPGTCGAGSIPVTAGTQAISTPVEPDATIGDTGSIAFWYSGNSNWDDSTDRMLFDASNNLGNGNADKHFYLVKRGGPGMGANNGSLRFAIEDSADTDSTATTGQFTFAANTWVHIAVTWDLPNDLIQIYVNGALEATSTTNVNGVLGNTATLYFGDQRMGGVTGTAGNYTTNSANGYVDEIKIFDSELSAGDVAALMTETHPCTAGPHHYSIVPNGTGVTCDALVIDVEAHDSGHGAFLPNNTTTITVIANATAPANVTWSVTNPGINTGTFTDNGDGTANYTFTGTESLVQFSLRYPFVEIFDIDVTDGTATDQDGVFEDDDAQFVEAIFRITENPAALPPIPAATIDTKLSGKPSNSAGFGQQTLYLQAIRTDDESGSCVGAFLNQTAIIQMAGECNNPVNCAGTAVTVLDNSASNIPIGINNNGMVPPAGNFANVTLDFDANSAAPLVFTYTDAGQITLHARYDIDPDPSIEYMFGGSNSFVVRPFGFDIDTGTMRVDDWSDDSTLNGSNGNTSWAADANGSVFVKSGENFDVTVRSVVWQSTDDADNDGVPDAGANLTNNATTPNFGNEIVTELVDITHTLVAPAGGDPGILSGGNNLDFTGSGGSLTIPLSWDEVGIIDLTAALDTTVNSVYLTASTGISTTHENFGRFYPDRFTVTDNGPQFADACTAGVNPFTYMGQTFFYGTPPELTVTAINVNGDVTNNYGDTNPSDPAQRFWKLASALPRTYVDTTGHGPANFADTATASVILSGDTNFDGEGLLALANDIPGLDRDSFLYTRTAEEEPFGASVDVTFDAAGLTDTDGVCYDPDDDDNCDDYTHLTQGGVEPGSAPVTGSNQRFGRLVIGTAAGSELLPLSVPFRTEYFVSGGFVTNTDDQCMALAEADIELTSAVEGPIAGGPVDISNAAGCADGTTSITMGAFTGGEAGLTFSAPGDECTGYADINLDLNAISLTIGAIDYPSLNFLRYDWNDDTSHDDNPTGRATFGVFEGPRNLIYIREPW